MKIKKENIPVIFDCSPDDLAKAIHVALRADDPDAHMDRYDDCFGPDDRIVIDGHFDLIRVAKRVLRAFETRS